MLKYVIHCDNILRLAQDIFRLDRMDTSHTGNKLLLVKAKWQTPESLVWGAFASVHDMGLTALLESLNTPALLRYILYTAATGTQLHSSRTTAILPLQKCE